MSNIKITPEDGALTVVFSGSYEDTPENADITIAEGIVEIAENAFRDFVNLRTVRLPKSLKRISACAFSGCKGLTRVEFS